MNREQILSGSINSTIFKISLPIIFATLLQTVYQLTDTFWVGRLGQEAVAAVSLSLPLMFFLVSLAMGLSMAGSILIAQYNGQNNIEKVSQVTGQTFVVVMIAALILSTIGYFISVPLLKLLTDDPNVLWPAVSYLQIVFLAIPAMFIFNIFQSAFRAIGKVKVPMYIIIATVILNFLLDPLLMFGWNFIPALGVTGVAWATLITEYLAALLGLCLLIKGEHGVKLIWSDFKPDRFLLKKIFTLGLPSSIEHSSRTLGMLLMVFLVSGFGTLVIAAYGIGTRLLGFIIIPALGFSLATSSLVGNNLGAKQHERAEAIVRAGLKISFLVLTIIGVIVFIFASPISIFFVPHEPELIAETALLLRLMALTFGFVGLQMVIIGALKAAGKTTLSMFLALFNAISLLGIGYLLAFPFGLNELGLWIAYPASNLVGFLLAWYFYQRKTWLEKKII